MPEKNLDYYLKRLSDNYQWNRQTAALIIGLNFKDRKAVEPLIELLSTDPYLYARAAAARALGRIGDLRALEPLIAALDDENADVRSSAAGALGDIGHPKTIEPLILLLGDDSHLARELAAEALRKFGGKGRLFADLFYPNLDDFEINKRNPELADHVGILIRLLKAKSKRTRDRACWILDGLCEMGNPKVADDLVDNLFDKKGTVREETLEFFIRCTKISNSEFLKMLDERLHEKICQHEEDLCVSTFVNLCEKLIKARNKLAASAAKELEMPKLTKRKRKRRIWRSNLRRLVT